MTALSADATRKRRDSCLGDTFPVKASEAIYKGALVSLDSNGYAVASTDSATDIACIGVAAEAVTGGTASGDEWIKVEWGRSYLFTASSITQAMLGTAMYVVDDNTVDDAAGATNDVFAGYLVEYVSATSGWVWIPGPVDYPTSGVTASVAELNILDGATVTYDELNKLDESATAGCGFAYASGTLSAAELKALRATPIEAIAAPGAGYAIVPYVVSLFMDHGGTDFVQTNGSDHLALRYSGGVEIDEIGTEAQCTALIEAAADAGLSWVMGGEGWVPTANEAVQFDNNGAAEWTTGDGVLDYYIIYAVVPVA